MTKEKQQALFLLNSKGFKINNCIIYCPERPINQIEMNAINVLRFYNYRIDDIKNYKE